MSFTPSVAAFSNPSTLRTAMKQVQQGVVHGLVHGNLVATMPSYDTLMVRFQTSIYIFGSRLTTYT